MTRSFVETLSAAFIKRTSSNGDDDYRPTRHDGCNEACKMLIVTCKNNLYSTLKHPQITVMRRSCVET